MYDKKNNIILGIRITIKDIEKGSVANSSLITGGSCHGLKYNTRDSERKQSEDLAEISAIAEFINN